MTPTQLIEWRKRWGYTQPQLADLLGLTRYTVLRWEKGQYAIPKWLRLALRAIELTDDGFLSESEKNNDLQS